jgi:hypothetical protein
VTPEDSELSGPTIEQRILVTMRKVLSTIVKEVTPPPGMQHPLSPKTIEDIRQCFGLIAARERELTNNPQVFPNYIDQPKTSQTIELKELIPQKSDQQKK